MDSHDHRNTEIDSSNASDDGSRCPSRFESDARAERRIDGTRRLSTDRALTPPTRTRGVATALAGLGIVAVAGGIAFPDARELLFAFGVTGLFGAILSYYLALGRFVEAAVAERIYAPMAANEATLAEIVGLQSWTDGAYVPPADGTPARLFVPARSDFTLDRDEASTVSWTDENGILLEATGAALFREFERTSDPSATEPPVLAARLADALTEQFELAREVVAETDVEGGCATVAIDDSALERLDRFDHPIVSFLAVGFATALGQPVRVDIDREESDGTWLVTCRWKPP